MPSPAPRPIAVDGPAASGKGTLARALAKKLGFLYLDTGALYRRLTLAVLAADIAPQDEARAVAHITDLSLTAPLSPEDEIALRSARVSRAAAVLAAQPRIRAFLRAEQRRIAQDPQGAVLDGRDIGTVVCPDAPLKFYVTADINARAHRRWLEWRANSPDLTEAQVKAELAARDEADRSRAHSPLKPAEDAHILDTSDTTPAEVLAAALACFPRQS